MELVDEIVVLKLVCRLFEHCLSFMLSACKSLKSTVDAMSSDSFSLRTIGLSANCQLCESSEEESANLPWLSPNLLPDVDSFRLTGWPFLPRAG
jgi:hypothetical protein